MYDEHELRKRSTYSKMPEKIEDDNKNTEIAPWYQRVSKFALYCLLGLTAFNAVVAPINNAYNFVTPRITYIFTPLIVIVWIVIEVGIKLKRVKWLVNGQLLSLTKLNLSRRVAIIVVLLLLWLPRVFDVVKGDNADITEDSESSDRPTANKNPLAQYAESRYRLRYIILDTAQPDIGESEDQIFALMNGDLKDVGLDLFYTHPYVMKTIPLSALLDLGKTFPDFKARGFIEPKTVEKQRVRRKFLSDPNYYVVTSTRSGGGDFYMNIKYSFGYVGASNYGDLAGNYKKFPAFTEALIHSNPDIPDIAAEDFFFPECGDPERLILLNRPFKVLIMDIENLGDEPLRVDRIEGVLHNSQSLKLTAWKDGKDMPGERVTYNFPQSLLTKGEHLVVPLKNFLGSFDEGDAALPHPESLPDLIPDDTISDMPAPYDFRVPAKERNPNLNNEYILGSWFEPELIGSIGNLRPFDKSEIVYHGPSGVGSCPFAFVLDESSGRWKNVGRLIPDRTGKEAEGVNYLKIPEPVNGQVVVAELEDEETFLDQLYLTATDETGKTIEIYPDDLILLGDDSIYKHLKKGERLIVKFKLPRSKMKDYTLVSEGFYLLGLPN